MSHRTAIVMSGGGSKGAFQVGVLKRMYEVGIRPQIVCGTSVGALNGAKLAENSETVIPELEALWLSLRSNEDVLALSPTVQTLLQAVGRLAGKEVTSLADLDTLQATLERSLLWRGIVLVALGLLPGPFGAVTQIIQLLGLRRRVVDVVDGVGAALNGASLFVTDPLRAKMVQHLDVSKVRSSGIELRVTAVDFQNGDLQLMDQNHPDLLEAVLASAVQPVFMEPRHPVAPAPGQLPHQFYDGGVREISPLQAAVDLGADRVYMILAGSLTVPPIGPLQGIFPTVSRTIELFTNEIARNDLHIQQEVNRLAVLAQTLQAEMPTTLLPDSPANLALQSLQAQPVMGRRPVDLVVFEPTFDPFDGSLDFDPAKIRQSMAHGYELASQVLPG
jgi:predicted acylesterase/phospholipase RssA